MERWQISEAIDAFSIAIELTSDSYYSRSPIYLAELLFELGEFEESERVIRPIEEDKRNEGFDELWLLLGNILEKLNKDEEAKEAFQKVKYMSRK
ncbi:MAG: hypothetical protein P1Q69_20085 [Candidatus Thorarchaeota archaeon]|nr:hypothetical protein [Candidatus Thorarchaeota archaeon]